MVDEYRDGDLRVPVGGLVELEDDEAARLIEDGVAVPATHQPAGEHRSSPPRA